jgi:hypothetical protein
MRKLILLMLVLITTIGGMAQYKKASFFTRNGKFYGLKAGLHVFGQGVSATPSISFVAGRDNTKKHIWHWWDIEYLASSKYHYSSADYNDPNIKVDVSGKIAGMLNLRYNWCYYLGDNTNQDTKGLPFVKIGVEVALFGRSAGDENYSPASSYPAKEIYREGANGGLDIGVGYNYRISDAMSVFGVAGYNWMLNESTAGQDNFFPNPSHPYINVGIKFARKQED